MIIHELRERIIEHLASQTICVLSTKGDHGSWSMPVRYRHSDLDIECLIPRWADVVFHLEQNGQVILVIQSGLSSPGCWIQYLGQARRMRQGTEPTLFDGFIKSSRALHLYEIFRVIPDRIDLVDESRGWGMRENLDLR
jgi:hypothetical protein